MARLNSQQRYRYRLFEKCGMAMTVDGSGDDRITLEGLDKPYTFTNDGDSGESEGDSDIGSDGPEGREEEGSGDNSGEDREDHDSSDDDDGDRFNHQ